MSGVFGSIRGGFARLRTDPTIHWLALVVALVVGIALAHVHWLGLVAGGALVGLLASSLFRALLAALGYGVVVLLVWTVGLWTAGSLGPVGSMGEISLLAVVIGLVAPLVGSLSRGII